ncbi:MAG: PD-(D/E)XK nuclease family protein [bacterium]
MKQIIICPDDFKKKRLSSLYSKKLINEDFYITLEQLKEKMFFKIETQAKLFARDFLNVKYSVAVTLLNNLYYVDNDFKHENLEKLRELKKELIKNNLLTFDNLFPFYLKRHEVKVMGYLLSKADMLLIDEVRKYTTVSIEEVSYDEVDLSVTKYNYIDEEVDNTFKNIINLLNNNVSLNDIKICNIDSNYIHLLRRYSSFYNIKINFKKNDSLLSSPVVNKFLDLYKENKNLEEVISLVKERFNNNDIVKKIISLINDINTTGDLTDVFLYEFEKLKFDEDRFDNAIEIVDFYNYQFNENNHVFVMNFNSGAIPKEFKDDQFLSDVITSNINLDTTQDKIKLELEQIKMKLFNIKNIYLSYKTSTKSKEYIASRLVEILKIKEVAPSVFVESSLLNAKLKVAIYLEEYIKYDTLNTEIFKYYYLIEKLFNSYKNDYTKVDVDLIKKRLDDNIKLSYTSLTTYYKCSFAFYLERVLKIRVNDSNFSADVGTILHEILEKMENEDYDYKHELEVFKEKFTTNKDLFFYNKLTNEFIESLDIIKEQKTHTALTEFIPELKVEQKTRKVFNREFVGLVDKVIYRKTPNHTYLAVIDYKTGHIKSTLDNVEEGFNLQLPIYAYMLKNTTRFDNPVVLGMFLQKISNKTPNYNPKVHIDKQRNEDLKLQGYIIGEDNIEMLDKSYEKSEMISKLKLNKKGELDRYSKVLSQEKFDELAIIVQNLIDKAFSNIEQVKFDINPKLINNVNESCMFCKYESICFKKTKDNVYLEKTNILKGSDDNVDETTETSN